MNAYTKALGPAATAAGRSSSRLHLNENGVGCSPAVLRALQTMTPDLIASYPDYGPAITAVASAVDVPEDWVMLTNGLDEAISLISAARFKGPGAGCVVMAPAFDMYAVSARTFGGDVRIVPAGPGFRFSLDAVLAASVDAALIFVTNPNNPTGVSLPDGFVASLADARPGALIFVDEAYAEYAGRSFLPELRREPGRFRNVVVGRTFSKAYGLAGLRVGALIAPPETLAPIEAIPSPFNVNAAAAVAIPAALSDRAWLDSTVAESRVSKDAIYDWCAGRGLEYWRSDANFVLIRVGPDAAASAAVVDALAARGVLVRDRSAAPGCAGCIRMTAGLVAHTARALRALEDVLASRTN